KELNLADEWAIYDVTSREEAYGHSLDDTRWVIRFDAEDGSSVIVQPNDLEAIERLAQQTELVVRARLTVRQCRWREQREDLFSPASMRNTGRLGTLVRREQRVAYVHVGCDQSLLAGTTDR
ncbi:hypothetical protein N9L68_04655, partial [bacterium]|nr:hypothetical protein [bacterium]